MGDRFCSACGDALAASGPSGDRHAGWGSDGAPGEPELLVLEPAPAGPDADELAAHGRRSPRVWLLVAAGVMLAAIALWGIGRSDSGSTGPDEAARPSATTDRPEVPSSTTADTTSTDDPAAEAETVLTYDPATGAPVLGHPVGWSLMVGQTFDRGLERIDLDSGQSTRYQVSGGPVAVLDGLLVLQAPGEGGGLQLRSVPLGDPAADGTELVAGSSLGPDRWPVFPGGDGALWVFAATRESTTWRLVRVSDGRLIDEVPAPTAFQVAPLPGGGPDVATSPSGGLYRRDGSGYRLVHPGRPIVVSRGVALVVSCSLPGSCVTQWVDVDRGEPVGRPLPPDDDDIDWFGAPDAAGRFLVGWRSGAAPVGGGVVLYDTGRLRLVEVGTSFTTDGVAATPDGRYLAVGIDDQIRIFDADQERWVAVSLAVGAVPANLLFVPNGEAP